MKRAFLIPISAMLASCGAFPEPAASPDDAHVYAPTAGVEEELWFAEPDNGENAGTPQSASVPRPKKKPASIAAVRPDVLVGLTPEEVEALIGRPVAKAEQPPATVWHYRASHCALEIFFYMDVGSKTFRALTFNMKRPDGENASPSLCLRQIRAISYGS